MTGLHVQYDASPNSSCLQNYNQTYLIGQFTEMTPRAPGPYLGAVIHQINFEIDWNNTEVMPRAIGYSSQAGADPFGNGRVGQWCGFEATNPTFASPSTSSIANVVQYYADKPTAGEDTNGAFVASAVPSGGAVHNAFLWIQNVSTSDCAGAAGMLLTDTSGATITSFFACLSAGLSPQFVFPDTLTGRHISSNTGHHPSIACGPGAGTSPSVCSISGTDVGGFISVTTGSGTVARGVFANVTFSLPYNSAPFSVTLTPANFNSPVSTDAPFAAFVTSRFYFLVYAGTTAIASSTVMQFAYTVNA